MDRIKRLSNEIMNEYQNKFGTDFSSNKQILNEITIIRSKSLKNKIAGYITKILQRQKKYEQRKKQLIEDENNIDTKDSKRKKSISESTNNASLKEETETNSEKSFNLKEIHNSIMNEEDKELENLKAKRLAEMQKNISAQEKQKENKNLDTSEKFKPTSRDSVIKKLGYRGMEVIQNAESQFPNESKIVIEKLGELIASGDINEILDGGKLLVLFRSVGINVRIQNKISVEQDGKFVSITDKFKQKTQPNDE